MNNLDKARSLVDKFNKTYAKAPMLVTGGDTRSSAEAMNTGAIARGHGQQRAIPRETGYTPLRDLVKINKKT